MLRLNTPRCLYIFIPLLVCFVVLLNKTKQSFHSFYTNFKTGTFTDLQCTDLTGESTQKYSCIQTFSFMIEQISEPRGENQTKALILSR